MFFKQYTLQTPNKPRTNHNQMKLIKFFFLVLVLNSTALFSTTFTSPGCIELGDVPDDTYTSVRCHDGDTIILHKGDYLSIQATTMLSPDILPSKEFSFYFDTDKYLVKNPSSCASADAGVLGNVFFSRMWVLAQDMGITKLSCVSLNEDNIAKYIAENINTLTDDRVKKTTITIDVQP